MATRGISAAGSVLIALVMMIVVGLIFSGFVRGSVFQEQQLISKGVEASGELPCLRGPAINMERVTAIIMTGSALSGPKDTKLKANIDSTCLENLTVTWNFGDGSQPVSTECEYPYDAENCKSTIHRYVVQASDIVKTKAVATVSAFGMRSGYFTEASTAVFVKDPTFKVMLDQPDPNNFACMKVRAWIFSIVQNTRDVSEGDYEVIDNGYARQIENTAIFPDDNIFNKRGAELTYRAELGSQKDVKVRVTRGYQTEEASTTYVGKTPVRKEELMVYSNPGNLEAYDSGLGKVRNFPGELFPDTSKNRDLAIGDLDGDLVDDFAFLLESDKHDETPAALYALPYFELKSQLTESLNKITKNADLKKIWPEFDLRKDADWRAVAIGNNIVDPDKGIGNIVVLSDKDLGLYNYFGGKIEEVNKGDDFPDNSWEDIAVYDVDGDGEDEIITVRDATAESNNDDIVYVFTYSNRKVDANTLQVRIPKKDWVAVAAGEMDGDANTVEIVVLGSPGDLDFMQYNRDNKVIAYDGTRHRGNWPNIESSDAYPSDGWKDMAAVDTDGDGKKELAFLYHKGGRKYIAKFTWDQLIANNYGTDNYNAWAGIARPVEISNIGWGAMAAGDFACT